MKLAYLLLAPALALTAAAQGTIPTRNFAIEGCLGLTAILDQTGAIAGSALTGLFQTESQCANACQDAGYKYAFFLGGQVTSAVTSCACSNRSPNLSQYVAANTAIAGSGTAGVCGNINFESISINPDIQLRACARANAITNTAVTDKGTVQTAAQCVSQCTAFAYAIVTYAGACSCATGTQVQNQAGLGACGTGDFTSAIYLNNNAPAASRGIKKRDFDMPAQRTLGLCPTGLQACLVGDDAAVFGSEGYECLDTRSELESCGGCAFGYADITTGASAVGTDCTALPGVALGGSTCTLGKCEVFACTKGYKLIDGRCQR